MKCFFQADISRWQRDGVIIDLLRAGKPVELLSLGEVQRIAAAKRKTKHTKKKKRISTKQRSDAFHADDNTKFFLFNNMPTVDETLEILDEMAGGTIEEKKLDKFSERILTGNRTSWICRNDAVN